MKRKKPLKTVDPVQAPKAKISGVIGIPTLGKVSTHFLMARARLQSTLAISWSDYVVTDQVMIERGYPAPFSVADKQNEIVKFGLQHNVDWILFWEDDVIAPPNALLKLLSRRKDIVSGVYWSKSEPPVPLIFRGHMKGPYYDWKAGDFIKADAAGMGLVLIKAKVFKKIPPPWFSENFVYHSLKGARARNTGTTSDLYFYKKAKDYGFQLFVDTSVQALHCDRNTGILFGLRGDMPQAIPASDIIKKGKKLIADIGCGTHSPYFKEGFPIRMDIREEVKPNIICDIRQIPEPDCKYDIVYSSNTLEHFSHRGVLKVLMEWLRILKVKGELRLIVPNIAWAARNILRNRIDDFTIWVLWGQQAYSKDFHGCGFTEQTLRKLLEMTHCLKNIKVRKTQQGRMLSARANKFKHVSFESISPEYDFKKGTQRKGLEYEKKHKDLRRTKKSH